MKTRSLADGDRPRSLMSRRSTSSPSAVSPPLASRCLYSADKELLHAETFHLVLMAHNPLDTQLILGDVTVEVTEGSASDQLEIETIERVTLEPGETRPVGFASLFKSRRRAHLDNPRRYQSPSKLSLSMRLLSPTPRFDSTTSSRAGSPWLGVASAYTRPRSSDSRPHIQSTRHCRSSSRPLDRTSSSPLHPFLPRLVKARRVSLV